MAKSLAILVTFIIVLKTIQSRKLWEPSLPEITASEVGKDINTQKVQITDLNGTLRQEVLSQHLNLTEIRIIRNQITDVEPGALCSAKSLKILELDLSGNKNPPTLTKSMFNNCKLDELFLKFDYNNPSKIDRNALENLELKTLAVDSLNLPRLERNFLLLQKSRHSLRSLTLSNIHVNTIQEDAFVDLTNLEELEIVHNVGLTEIPRGVFKSLRKLKRLSLRDNAIKNLSWHEFEGLSQLDELELGDNQIGNFDANKIATNMPKLTKLSIQMNSVACTEERSFVGELKEKLKSVEVTGNDSNHLC